jgi:type II secretory pathway component PulJ
MKRLSFFLPRPRRNRRGMVLFEVMLALSIFALVGFSLVMALDAAFDAASERNEIDTAMRGLQNQMALLHDARVTPGEIDPPDDGSGFHYRIIVEVEQLKDEKQQPLPNMYSATISATWTSKKGQQEERDVTELIYQP